MKQPELRRFTEPEYHAFFREYVSDPLMDPSPFVYNREQVSRSYLYNHGGFREDYDHYGVFLDNRPVGSFQLKSIDTGRRTCEFGIILQNDRIKNLGVGTEAIRLGMELAREKWGVETMTGDTMRRNKRMIRVFEKLGFILVETVPDAFQLPDGTTEDRLVFRKQLTEEQQ